MRAVTLEDLSMGTHYDTEWMNRVDPTGEVFIPLFVCGGITLYILTAVVLTLVIRRYLNKYWPHRPAWIN